MERLICLGTVLGTHSVAFSPIEDHYYPLPTCEKTRYREATWFCPGYKVHGAARIQDQRL